MKHLYYAMINLVGVACGIFYEKHTGLYWLSGINYACNKIAWQSSDHDETTKATKAVDTFDDTMAKTRSEPWPLLTVDITRAIHIAEIYVVTDDICTSLLTIGIDHDTVCARVVGTAIRNSTSCAGRRAATQAGTTSAVPDCSTNHDSADRISRQFLFYCDHNLQKVRETCVFDFLYRCSSPSAFA